MPYALQKFLNSRSRNHLADKPRIDQLLDLDVRRFEFCTAMIRQMIRRDGSGLRSMLVNKSW